MVTVMPPCGLPGFGGGTTSQGHHFSRYHFPSLEVDMNSQHQAGTSRGKFIQSHETQPHSNMSIGKNIYNGHNQVMMLDEGPQGLTRDKLRSGGGKQIASDTIQNSQQSIPQHQMSRGKSIYNGGHYQTSNDTNHQRKINGSMQISSGKQIRVPSSDSVHQNSAVNQSGVQYRMSRGKNMFNGQIHDHPSTFPPSQEVEHQVMAPPRNPLNTKDQEVHQISRVENVYNSQALTSANYSNGFVNHLESDPINLSVKASCDTKATTSSSTKGRGKNISNYSGAAKVNSASASHPTRTSQGKVMPPATQGLQHQMHIFQSQNNMSLSAQNEVKNNLSDFAPSSSCPTLSFPIVSSSRVMMQHNNTISRQEDMSSGEGGPPKVRFSAGNSETLKPLFVDCSVEYELPKMAKIPSDSLPLLMVHPDWQQKKPITRSSSSQQQLQTSQQYQSVTHQHQPMYPPAPMNETRSCSQCPTPASMSVSRGRKRTLNGYPVDQSVKNHQISTGNGCFHPTTSGHQLSSLQQHEAKRARLCAPTFENWPVAQPHAAPVCSSVTLPNGVFQQPRNSFVKMMPCGCPYAPPVHHPSHQGATSHSQQPNYQPGYHQYHGVIWSQCGSQCPPPLPAPPIHSTGHANVWATTMVTTSQASTSTITTGGRLLRSQVQQMYNMPTTSAMSNTTQWVANQNHQRSLYLQHQEQQRQHWLLQQRLHLQHQQQQMQQQQQQATMNGLCPKCPGTNCHWSQPPVPAGSSQSTTLVRYRSV